MSVSKIVSSKNSAKYYTSEENYYLSEADAKNTSFWWGEGAKKLGLDGKVTEVDLDKMLNGELSNGRVVGFQKNGERIHRPGYNLCFTAPKSVSILA